MEQSSSRNLFNTGFVSVLRESWCCNFFLVFSGGHLHVRWGHFQSLCGLFADVNGSPASGNLQWCAMTPRQEVPSSTWMWQCLLHNRKHVYNQGSKVTSGAWQLPPRPQCGSPRHWPHPASLPLLSGLAQSRAESRAHIHTQYSSRKADHYTRPLDSREVKELWENWYLRKA